MSDNNKQSIGIKKASEKLKKKLKEEERVSLKDYKLSEAISVKSPELRSEERHRVKRNKRSFYLSNTAVEALDKVYITRFSENNKTDKSSLICEAIDLLYSKQKRRKIEFSNTPEQTDLFQ